MKHGSGLRTIGREHPILTIYKPRPFLQLIPGVVVEKNHFHALLTTEVCQLSNTLLIVRIYHDQALDAIHIQPAQLQHGKSLVMQGDEITDVAVHRPRKDNARLWVEPMCCHSTCLLYTSPSPRDRTRSRMPSSA